MTDSGDVDDSERWIEEQRRIANIPNGYDVYDPATDTVTRVVPGKEAEQERMWRLLKDACA